MNYYDKPPLNDETLAHFGVKGMKWGVRRGSLTDRYKSATVEQNKALLNRASRLRSNKNLSIGESLLRKTGVAVSFGSKRYDRHLDKQSKILRQQTQRIKAGKSTANDILDMAGRVSILELLVKEK